MRANSVRVRVGADSAGGCCLAQPMSSLTSGWSGPGTGARYAAATSSAPNPIELLHGGAGERTPRRRSMSVSWPTSRSGCSVSKSAAAPATAGAAKDVPVTLPYPLEHNTPGAAVTMSAPGATRSSPLPVFEKGAGAPLASDAPTAITCGYAAGAPSEGAPSLPVAAITGMPRLTAELIANLTARADAGSTSLVATDADTLMTFASAATARSIPATKSSGVDSPRSSKILIGMI